MKIIMAEKMGFCIGVKRAVEMVESAAKDGTPTIINARTNH